VNPPPKKRKDKKKILDPPLKLDVTLQDLSGPVHPFAQQSISLTNQPIRRRYQPKRMRTSPRPRSRDPQIDNNPASSPSHLKRARLGAGLYIGVLKFQT